MKEVISILEKTPAAFAALARMVPRDYVDWRPDNWEGVPSETFTVLGQACHLRDIEIDGYHVRFRRTLEEEKPDLISLDSYALEKQRAYHTQHLNEMLEEFTQARTKTIAVLRDLTESDWNRSAMFAEYGTVTLCGLAHLLCSHDQQHLAGVHWLLAKIPA